MPPGVMSKRVRFTDEGKLTPFELDVSNFLAVDEIKLLKRKANEWESAYNKVKMDNTRLRKEMNGKVDRLKWDLDRIQSKYNRLVHAYACAVGDHDKLLDQLANIGHVALRVSKGANIR